MTRIFVSIITGFLGSGKTTLLNSMLRHPGMSRVAVIVNEFGEIGIDYDLVERSSETIVQLENGCLCCTVKGDLIDTFRDLYIQRKGGHVPWFDRVIIETTGIADPGPVMQIILTDPMISSAYQLDGIVTLVDAVNGNQTLDHFPESVNQVAVADRIVLSKTDLTQGTNNISALSSRIAMLNPAAPLIACSPKDIAPDDLFAMGFSNLETGTMGAAPWLDPDAYNSLLQNAAFQHTKTNKKAELYYKQQRHQPKEHHNHDPLIHSFCIVRNQPLSIDTIRLFLEGLALEAGPDLLRVKGIVNVREHPGKPAVIHGAQKIFHSLEWLDIWPSADERSRIVFITRGLEQAYMEDTLDFVERMAERTHKYAGLEAQ